MIFRQEGFQVLGAFPSAFSYPAESHDSSTLRSELLLAEQPPREIQHEPDPGKHARSTGDEDLRDASLMDRSGASFLSSVDSELMSSLT